MADGATPQAVPQTGALLDEGGPPREKRFTVAEFLRLGEAGGLDDPCKYELWDGRVMMAPPAGGAHMKAEQRLTEALILGLLKAGLLATHKVQNGGGVAFNDLNFRAPDVMVVRPVDVDRFYQAEHIFLVVEIAKSSLADDLGEKRTKYAAADIPEYWVLDVRGRQLHLFREPRYGDYAVREVLDVDGVVAPAFAPQVSLRVGDLV